MAQRFTAERVLNAIKYGVTVTWWWIMVKKLSVIKIFDFEDVENMFEFANLSKMLNVLGN